MMGWEELRRQRHKRQLDIGLLDPIWQLSATDSSSYDWQTANQEWEALRMAVYAAMIDSMDQNIGRIMQTLEQTGVDENTLVMFLSDNGGCAEEPGGRNPKQIPGPKQYYTAVGPAWGWAQNTPFRRYKSWVHEGGISTPLIIRWPEVVQPSTLTHQMGHLIDFMATCVDLANVEYPRRYNGHSIIPLEGKSLVPVLHGKVRVPHDQLCWEWNGNRAIRQGKWKCVWDKLVKSWELYDLQTDRTEVHDLAMRYPQRVESMSQAWFTWAKTTTVNVAD